LTEAGRAFVEGAGPALQDITDRIEQIRAVKGRISGLLRLNVPSVALPIVMTPLVRQMTSRFPDVRLKVFIDDAIANIVADGFDAGIRLGEIIDEDMITVRLTPQFQAIIVAASAYIADHGRPRSVADLGTHNCIAYRQIKAGGLYRWDLVDGSRDVTIDTPGSVIVNNAVYARELAISGVGLAYVFEPLVRADIAAGSAYPGAAEECGG
jgi:DNA-binding transcriptional LysR family regulator